ncbi:MAG: MBL fold metallo-hydrolase, partial [bacterium]|nr:MBL fold metallo-hydrolase [bacterium]
MKITFHGAAGEVTGSQHLIECGGARILLDGGLFQGRREETYRKNRHPAYDPATLHAVVLSHAHLDHCGLLPRLAAQGFRGLIHCTPGTAELCDPMLRDSAHVQEKDVEFVNKIHRRKGQPEFHVLYGLPDVEQVLDRLTIHDLHRPFDVAPGVQVKFIEAGHVLGSAQVLLELDERGQRRRVG